MKLKRILSLALSGVLAVSMLTACGSGGISNILNDRSNTVRSALNGAQSMLTYKASDRNLDEAIATVAESLTAGQVTNDVADSNVAGAVRQLTGYGDISLGEAWKAQTTVGEKTYVKVFVYNVDDSEFDEASEVAQDVASKLDSMKLKDDLATKGEGVTNSYKGYVSAYEKTIGTGDDAFDAWVVGVAVEQTVKAAA